MPAVSGELKSIIGETLASRVGKLYFRLNEPNIGAVGAMNNRIIPTATEEVIPSSSGAFTFNPAPTEYMLFDAWYIMTIEWKDTNRTLTDFPQWQIRVPNAGGDLTDMIFPAGGGQGSNLSLVLLSLTKPPNLKVGQLWFKTDPSNPSNPANTGQIWIGE